MTIMFCETLKQLFGKFLQATLAKHVCAVVFVLIEVNDDITSAHSVSMLYNQHLQIRRHIFLQDIC